MFFDTNILSLQTASKLDKASEDILLYHVANKTAYLSHMVVGEILAFSGYSELEIENIYKSLKNNFHIKYINNDIMLLASEISRKQKQKTDKKLKLTDSIIAATAIYFDMPLLTLDKKDFKNIKDLKIVNHEGTL